MSTVTKTYFDLVCDHPDCGTELSAFSDIGYADEQDAREEAEDVYDWWCEPGRDLCPDHRPDLDEETG